MSVQRGIAHSLQNGWEVCGEGAEGGVETEYHDGLEIVFVIDESSKDLGEVDGAFLIIAAAFYGALADDVILTCGQEATLGWRVGEVEISHNGEQ